MANYKNDTLINVIIIVIPRLAIKRLLEAKAKEAKRREKNSLEITSIHPTFPHTHTANFKRKSWKIKIVSCYSYDIVFNIQLGWPNRHERTSAGRKAVLTVDCI